MGSANSGGGNTGVALGWFPVLGYSWFPPLPDHVPGGHCPTTTVKGTTSPESVPGSVATLPVTGSNSSAAVTLALGLMLSGAAAVTLRQPPAPRHGRRQRWRADAPVGGYGPVAHRSGQAEAPADAADPAIKS